MTPFQPTVAADPIRQAAYRRLALTILALDVPTVTSRLQVSRSTPQRIPLSSGRVYRLDRSHRHANLFQRARRIWRGYVRH